MTTSPIANLLGSLVPSATPVAAGQQGTDGSTADAFLALVQGLLDEATAQPTAQPPADPAVAAETAEAPVAPVAEDADPAAPADLAPALPDPSAAVAAVPVFVPQSIQIQPTTPTSTPAAAQPMAPEASASVDAVASVAAVATGQSASAPAAPVEAAVDAAVEAGVVAAAPKTVKTPGDAPTVALPADGPTPATVSTAKVELPDVAVRSVEQPAAPTTETAAAPAPAPAPAPTQAPSVAPVAGVAPTTTVAPVVSAPADAHQVTQQVFPEVVRVVNNPNGPQRVTIKLNPEALGEVRVVLTSRQGGLEVSLAAGSDARAALTEGASELHRLLDMVGRGDARVVVRELNGTLPGTTISQPASAGNGSGVPNDLAGGAGSGTGRPGGDATSGQQHRNPAPGSSNATDGTQVATNPSRTPDPVTRAHTGVDVTM